MSGTTRVNGAKGRSAVLVDELTSVLRRGEIPRSEPIIVENPIRQTKSAHVTVIWDEWDHLFRTMRDHPQLSMLTPKPGGLWGPPLP
jgi:hypothetical protein